MWKQLSITIVCKQLSKYDAQNLQCTAQNVLRQRRVFSAGLKHTKAISFLPDVTTQVSNFNQLCSKSSEGDQKKLREVATGRAAAEAINDEDAVVEL